MNKTPIIYGEPIPSEGSIRRARVQDLRSPQRAVVSPVEDSYHVFPLPIQFQWCTLSVEPGIGFLCTVSFTISSPEAIATDNAIWHTWDAGEVDALSWHEWENPWLAVRIDCTGPTRVEIAAKY